MTFEMYKDFCLKKIARAANPTNGSEPNPRGCSSTAPLGKAAQKKFNQGPVELEQWLTKLRDDGVLRFTNGHWWAK